MSRTKQAEAFQVHCTVALFVLSYARRDGETLVRKFFRMLCEELSGMYPAIPYPDPNEIGFMDTSGIPAGAIWQETLGGKLESSPILVPIFSPSFFASEPCGQEVQAFLERIEEYRKNNPPPALTPNCILPVIWRWENLQIHPSVTDFHRDNENYPPKYRTKEYGLRTLVNVSSKINAFKILVTEHAKAINESLKSAQAGLALPVKQMDYRKLPSAFASINASAGASGPRSVRFAYIAPTRAELSILRKNLTSYGQDGREWRAFDPSYPGGIGLLSEGVAAGLKMSYDRLPLDAQFATNVKATLQAKGQTVFVIDSWAAQTNSYDSFFQELDNPVYLGCPVLVPLNERDEENRNNRARLLDTLAKKLPGRATAGVLAFLPAIRDEIDYESQLTRALATRQSEMIATTEGPAGGSGSTLPMI